MKKYITGQIGHQTTIFGSWTPWPAWYCGGDSSRMGEDKCFLRYHHFPQWEHLSRQLLAFCPVVAISCQLHQFSKISAALPTLPHPPRLVADLPEYGGHGPMSGLLSVAQLLPNHAFLLVGCDYPHLTSQELQSLVGARRKGADAVCYVRHEEDLDEPLVAIYETTALPIIQACFRLGAYSLRRALQKMQTIRLAVPAGDTLASADTPADFHRATERMKSNP